MQHIKTSLSLIFISLFAITAATAQLKHGDIIKIKNVNSGKYAQPQTASPGQKTTAINTDQIVIYTSTSDAQANKWKVVVVRGGFFTFQNLQTNKFLGVQNSSKDQYGFINQKAAGADLQWTLEKTTTGYKLKNRNSGLFAAVEGGGKDNNAKLIQWADQSQPDIIWQFETVGTGSSTVAGQKVMYDVILNYIAVSESTRNRIDNGDCKRVFGSISVELWELDESYQLKTRLQSYNNMPERLFNETNYGSAPTIALSKFQDDAAPYDKDEMGKVTYNIPENLLLAKRLKLIIKTNLGTRHKDNDFASYDALKMKEEKRNEYRPMGNSVLSETILATTDLTASTRDMHINDLVIPFAVFQRTDDIHKLFVKFTAKIQ